MGVVTATIISKGKTISPEYDLLSIDITKELNRIPYAELVFIDGDLAKQKFEISNSADFEPGKEIEIKLRYEGEPEKEATVFKGIVINHTVSADINGSCIALRLKNAAYKLTTQRKSAVFKKKKDGKIISEIIEGAGLEMTASPLTEYEHKELVQYYCSDWDFIMARADANGFWVFADDEGITVESIAKSVSKSAGKTLKVGIDNIYSFELETNAGQQYKSIKSKSWDIGKQTIAIKEAKDFNNKTGNLKPATAAGLTGGAEYVLVNPAYAEEKETEIWANAMMMKSRMAMVKGVLKIEGDATLGPGEVITIEGIGDKFNGQALITGIRHQISNGTWTTDIQLGLSENWFLQSEHVSDIQASSLLPAVNGLQIGIIDKFEKDPDKHLRVRVKIPALGDDKNSIWARMATPDGGNKRGFFFRPEVGDEVIVGFFNNDPRQAVILGSMYSSKNVPPVEDAKIDAKNNEKGIVTKGGIQILFNDEEKSLKILTSDKQMIFLNEKEKSIVISDVNKNKITMSKDGIIIKSGKDIKLEATGNVEIKGKKVDVK